LRYGHSERSTLTGINVELGDENKVGA